MSSFGSALVLASIAKGALLVGLVAVVIAAFRVRSASVRHVLWTSAVLAHLAIPALTLLLPPMRLTMPTWMPAMLIGPEISAEAPLDFTAPGTAVAPAPAWVVGSGDRTPGAVAGMSSRGVYAPSHAMSERVVVAGAAPAAARPRRLGVAEGRRSMRDAFRTVLSWPAPSPWMIAWIAGALVVLVRLAAGTSRVAKLAHKAQPIVDPSWLVQLHEISRELEISRPVRLLKGNRLQVPVTWGIVYPVVLLPPHVDGWLPERRRHVLVHELAHVSRLDALTQLAAQCVLALFWFDPLVWYAVDRMRVERERACDDVVLRRGAAPSRYASDLLDLARALDATHIDATPAFATLAMARRHDFEGRMLAILDPDPDRSKRGTRGTAIAAAMLGMVLLPLSALRGRQVAEAAMVAPGALVAVAAPAMPAMPEMPAMPAMPEMPAMPGMPVIADMSPMSHTPAMRAPVDPALFDAMRELAGGLAESARACERLEGRSGSSTSIHSDHDDGWRSFSYTTRNATRCAHVEVQGGVSFNDEGTDIDRLAPGARILIEERSSAGRLRRFSAMSHDGAIEREYAVNDRQAPFDAEARQWLAAMIQEVVREAGIDAGERTARMRREGGVPAVLEEIARISSTQGKRAYYEALLQEGNLEERDLEQIVSHMGRDLAASAGDLSAVLGRLPVLRGRPELYAALEDAFTRIDSDGDRARTLNRYIGAGAGDHDLLAVVLHAARGIESDGEKASVLLRAAPHALSSGDDSLRTLYFRAAQSIGSDGDLRRVLTSAAHFGHASSATSHDLIRTAKKISSDGDKAAVLVAIADARLLVSNDLQDAFVDAARSIGSDGAYRRVMGSAMRR